MDPPRFDVVDKKGNPFVYYLGPGCGDCGVQGPSGLPFVYKIQKTSDSKDSKSQTGAGKRTHIPLVLHNLLRLASNDIVDT